jgi:HlyD family secretion protein
MKKSISKTLLVLGVVIIVIGGVILVLMQTKAKVKSEIRTGQIEMRQIKVSSKLPGRIEWLRVDEGDTITTGMELFKVTGREITAKVNQAKGSAEAAKAQFNMSVEGARKEQIEMADRNWRATSTQYDLAEKTVKRLKPLFDEGLISSQEFDIATQKLNGANELMQAAKAQLDMAKNGSRSQEKAMAYGQYQRALGSIDEAQAYLDETVVYAPAGGICVKRYAELGEVIAAGYPVVAFVDPEDTWVELNLTETDLQKLSIGKEIDGFINSTGRTERWKVTNYSAMADFANWRAQNEKGAFDIRTFTVKLRPVGNLTGLRPGMTVSFDLSKVN